MKKEILHQNKAEIEYYQREYRSAATGIQTEIDKLIKEGIPLTDEAIKLLATAYNQYEDWLTDVVKAEIKSFKFEFQRKEAEREMGVLYSLSIKAHTAILNLTTPSVTGQPLSFSNFEVKDRTVTLKKGLDDQIVDQFTIYVDSEAKREVLQMANDIIERVDALNKYVERHGNYTRGIGINLSQNGVAFILGIEYSILKEIGDLKLNVEALRNIH